MCLQNGDHWQTTVKMYFENAIEAMVILHFPELFRTKGVITRQN